MLRPILLVEDNPNDVELTLIALEKTRLANPVVSLRDGEEALLYLRREGPWASRAEENPAVILLDKKLPKIDGHELLKIVRSDDKLKRIPVVMLTSSREETDLLRSYDLGVNAYVVKPVAFDDFMAAINDLGMFWGVLNEPPPYPR
ncbi:response regulator [Paraburkholderia fungorum]|uniref:CheY-like chemotaxis protein n=1 Tax=Paraburkholderia fungorum TaxID=134537 RepID=A0AAJ4CGV6_9BURK|nr:response regulator [Paraburkholderia fungorum]KFX67048.1 chemotaxis protein CheY [Burkholderia sp. K24]AJZ63599.1 response regulator [Paraburkholderia fungorum]MBB4512346.1 CheY-like chemotaxis protein [Paraburkholderia fungorum]MBB5540047.1 CheY-like chemotaxis protein [Paraburkholderia fungorum]MBB6200252.1 CheY-like chemotaxis protein [Paraburkholderia fungorum]